MSRAQWGHGYYTGIKEGEKYLSKTKYVACLDQDNHIDKLYRVLRKVEDVYTVEDITNCLEILVLTGSSNLFGVPTGDNQIDYNDVSEMSENDLKKDHKDVIWFSNNLSCECFCKKDFESWLKERRH